MMSSFRLKIDFTKQIDLYKWVVSDKGDDNEFCFTFRSALLDVNFSELNNNHKSIIFRCENCTYNVIVCNIMNNLDIKQLSYSWHPTYNTILQKIMTVVSEEELGSMLYYVLVNYKFAIFQNIKKELFYERDCYKICYDTLMQLGFMKELLHFHLRKYIYELSI